MSDAKRDADPLDSAQRTVDGVTLWVSDEGTVPATQPTTEGLPSRGTIFGGDDGGRFELLELLGRGGMGAVFLASDRLLERRVAIKFIAGRDDAGRDLVALLRQEARAAARLNHEAIVRVFDLDTYDGKPFIVMEYVEGQPLSSIGERGELDALGATRIVADVARGLAHAHHIGIIHCDLKPSNVLVKDGRAKILDFGLARIFRTQEALTRTATSPRPLIIFGTPLYMSPEQWRGEPVDGRSDLWALGVIFFELLTGRRPVDDCKLLAIRERLLSSEPLPSVGEHRPDLPTPADALIARALSKKVADRFATADEFLEALVALEASLLGGVASGGREGHVIQPRPRATHRHISVASFGFANVVSGGGLEGEEAAERLAELFEIVRANVRQYEGTCVASVGGRVLAYFGHPAAHEDDAQRAVRASLLVSDAVRALEHRSGVAAGFKVGIHTGAVLVGGGSITEGAILQGIVPDVAMALEREAEPKTIVISGATAELTGGLFDIEALGARASTGSKLPTELFRVLGQKTVSSRFEQAARVGLTPLVGRDREFGLLTRLWSRVVEGEGQLAVITGEAGIGKSRLVEATRDDIVGRDHTKLTAQCWEFFRNAAFHPLVDVLQRSAGVLVSDSAADKRAKLRAFVDRLGLDPAHLAALSSALSIPPEGASVNLSPDTFRLRLINTAIAIVARVAQERPTLLVVEDLHWSDASTEELLVILLDRLVNMRLLVLVTCRSEYQHSFPARSQFHEIRLARLLAADTARMAALAAGGRRLPADVTATLVERTDGVPLFIEELTRVIVESWDASRADEKRTSVPGTFANAIPATLNELLLARLDRVEGAGKEVAQLAAVLGRDFTFELVQKAAHVPEALLRQGLMQLVNAGLLNHHRGSTGARYTFKHALIQEMAYRSTLRSQRQSHHLRVAETLVRDFAAVAEQQPELLAHHFAEAGAAEQALPYLERAGERAVQRSAHTDAITHYRRAIDLLSKLPAGIDRDRKELSLRLALGSPLMAVKGYANADVEANYARALELCGALGDDAQFFSATLGLWQFSMVRGQIQSSVQVGQQLLAQARRANSATSIMLAHRALGTSCLLAGDLAAARKHTTAGLGLYDPDQHGMLGLRFGHDPGVAHGLYRGLALWLLGYADDGLEASRAALSLARRLKHPVSIAFALCYVAVVELLRGESSSARDHADEASSLSTQHELALWLAMSRVLDGWALAALGRVDPGIEMLQGGVDAWRQTGARAGVTCFQAALARALLAADRVDEAVRVVDEGLQIARSSGEHFFRTELLRLRGEAFFAAFPPRAAEGAALLQEALAISRREAARSFELRTAMTLSQLLTREGRRVEAAEILRPVYEWFTQGSDTVDIAAARALLDDLKSIV